MSRLILIVIAILLIALTLGGYFLWWPKYQELKVERAKLEVKETEIEKKEEYLSSLEKTVEKLAGYTEELAKIDAALPKEASLPTLFNFFMKTTAENGLILKDINATIPSTKGERIQEIPISISVFGSYSAVKNFLSVIYKNARLFEVNSIGFSFPSEKELFTFSLSLKTHFYKEGEVKAEEKPGILE